MKFSEMDVLKFNTSISYLKTDKSDSGQKYSDCHFAIINNVRNSFGTIRADASNRL